MQNTLLLRQKMPIVRAAAVIAVPALASLLGIIWFRRRKKNTDIVVCVGKSTLPEICSESKETVINEKAICQSAVELTSTVCSTVSTCDAVLASDSLQSACDLDFSIIDSETVIDDVMNSDLVPTYSTDCASVSPGTSCTDNSLKIGTSVDTSVDMLSEDSGSNSLAGLGSYHLPAYQFYFPTELCGMLIGKDGRHINGISRRSGADISVRVQPDVKHLQLVSINGSESQVRQALHAIKLRFPLNLFPNINYDNIIESQLSPQEPVHIQLTQLFLDEDAAVDALVSSVVAADHVFVQQPARDTFRFLHLQNYLMQVCYGQSASRVPLPRPVLENTLCAAPMFNGWFRAMVMSYYYECDECLIRFVDYGGYARLAANLLQQIRSDFTSLPFQAVECYLSDIAPPTDNLPYSDEAKCLMEQLVRSQPLVAQVVGYTEDGITCINLFRVIDGMLYNITDELVARGIARRVWPSTVQQVF